MPPYRLQVLLDIRTKAEDEAKEAFSVAIRALEQEKQTLAKLQQDLERRKAERKARVAAFIEEVTKKGGGITGFQQMGRFEERLKDEETQAALEIERQKEAVVEAEQVVDERRLEMAEAAKERKAIEKHRDTWKAQVRKELMTKEEMTQEEIGSVLHLQRARSSEKKK